MKRLTVALALALIATLFVSSAANALTLDILPWWHVTIGSSGCDPPPITTTEPPPVTTTQPPPTTEPPVTTTDPPPVTTTQPPTTTVPVPPTTAPTAPMQGAFYSAPGAFQLVVCDYSKPKTFQWTKWWTRTTATDIDMTNSINGHTLELKVSAGTTLNTDVLYVSILTDGTVTFWPTYSLSFDKPITLIIDKTKTVTFTSIVNGVMK